MRWFVLLWVFLIGIGVFGWWKTINTSSLPQQAQVHPTSWPTRPITPALTTSSSLFVPYWNLRESTTFPSSFQQLLYFGISVDGKGIMTDDPGYTSLSTFSQESQGHTKLLVIRMVNGETNTIILRDSALQQKIIDASVALAKKNQFAGIVTDLEMSALPFNSLVQNINTFNDKFASAAKKQALSYGITMYGDVFYRIRPFDMQHLAQVADTMYVLAYDLHKSNGQPGPNFPLDAGHDDYSLKSMLRDYGQVTSFKKIVIVFGLFGYDWTTNPSQTSSSNATALSYDDMKQKFLDGCTEKNCQVVRDTQSSEMHVSYIDKNNQNHSVWFDDPTSVETKKHYLQSQGISAFSYWAYGYF